MNWLHNSMLSCLRKWGWLGLSILMVVFTIWNFSSISYLLKQGKGQFSVIWDSVPVEQVLESDLYPDSVKAKIRLVQEIRKFAFDSLGLKENKNYTTFYDQKGKPILWVLTACPPFELKPKEWNFPLIGSVSYKGFFDRSEAVKEEEALKREGFDTDLSEVSGWSTLGWFTDPILSDMLNRSEGSLANLIIHELTHGTLFIPDNVDYNENLASFVGDLGARRYLTMKYGADSEQMNLYLSKQSDYKKFTEHMIKGAKSLDSLYQSEYFLSLDEATKFKQKWELIKKIELAKDTLSCKIKNLVIDTSDLANNTYFADMIRYRGMQNDFYSQFENQFEGNFKLFLSDAKKRYGKQLKLLF